jgi:hypothetical protein
VDRLFDPDPSVGRLVSDPVSSIAFDGYNASDRILSCPWPEIDAERRRNASCCDALIPLIDHYADADIATRYRQEELVT